MKPFKRAQATALVLDALEMLEGNTDRIDYIEGEPADGIVTVIPVDGPAFEITIRITGVT